ncbi:MAG TPA: hypothetical protein PKZ31_11775 [Kaistella chaponensis]|jgi:hypothetical protein|uniref:hypothetical protein n=1 Tax=Kaistella chaponensis TaxID=713588 RepID=UPI002BFE5D4D|nr:hypothetical protein [Kaistella chaponensis]HPW89773.1 hypothetical protein [Kaistella chaponensis]
MSTEDKDQEQERKLEEMDYSPNEDIFAKGEQIPLDGDGNPITNENQNDGMPYGLDIPGFEDDDNFEQINSQIPTEDESLHTEDIIEDDLEENDDDI